MTNTPMKSQYFIIQELVPEGIFQQRGQAAWELIDPRLVESLDLLRTVYGPMIINTWHSSKLVNAYGHRDQSGLRTHEFYGSLEVYFRSYSQHKYGRAADILFRDKRAAEVRRDILLDPSQYHHIGGIELDVPWLHIDVRNTDTLKKFSKNGAQV